MTRDEAIRCFCQWFDDGCVGNLVMFRSPRSSHVDCVIEETIKLREFAKEDQKLVLSVFDILDSEKVEMFRDKFGNPDRVKVIRRG